MRGHKDGHGGALFDIALDTGHQRIGDQVAESILQFFEVLDRMATLPPCGLPLFLGHASVTRQTCPIRLDKFALQWIRERLLAGMNSARWFPGWPHSFCFGRSRFGLTHMRFPVSGEHRSEILATSLHLRIS